MSWGPWGSWFADRGEWANFWQAWRGTNTGFDQSLNAQTNDDTPWPIVTPASGATWPYLDDFNRADSSTLGGLWLELVGTWEIVSNELKNTTAADADAYAVALHDKIADARVKITLRSATPGVGGLIARLDADFILAFYDNGSAAVAIFDVVGGSPTLIGSVSSVSWAQGDRFELQVKGTDVTVYKNGASILTATTTVTAVGYTGVFGSTTNELFDDFSSSYPEFALILAGGTYAVTGSAMTPKVGRKLPLDAGSYAFTGTALTFKAARRLDLGSGAYNFTGTAVGFAKGRRITLDGGSYAFTGAAATLLAARRLPLAAGSYQITGGALGLTSQRRLTLASGAYAVTGATVDLRAGRKLALAAGSYAVTGFALGLLAARRLTLDPGSYLITGSAVDLLKTGSYALALEAGSYAVTGSDVGLTYTPVVVPPAVSADYRGGGYRGKLDEREREEEEEILMMVAHLIPLMLNEAGMR